MVIAETPFLESDGKPGCCPCSWCQSKESRMRGAAFFRLAGYIGVFAEVPCIGRFCPPQNTADASGAKQPAAMAMTAPVQMAPQAMAMTAPVQMKPQAMAMTAPVQMKPQAMEMTAPVQMAPTSNQIGSDGES